MRQKEFYQESYAQDQSFDLLPKFKKIIELIKEERPEKMQAVDHRREDRALPARIEGWNRADPVDYHALAFDNSGPFPELHAKEVDLVPPVRKAAGKFPDPPLHAADLIRVDTIVQKGDPHRAL